MSEPAEEDMNTGAAARFRGCLVASAIGDCLGANFEGLWSTAAAVEYERGELDPLQLPLQPWTDDTAMMVDTAASVIAKGSVSGPDLARRYLAWFEAGGRGIGRSTFRAMRRLQRGVPWHEAGEEGEFAAGNGVAMRIAPVGLLHAFDRAGLERDVHTCGTITHRNDEAIAGGLAVAHMVAALATGDEELRGAAEAACEGVKGTRAETSIGQGLELAASDNDPKAVIAEIGAGGAAWETVGSAVYCCVKWEESITDAIAWAALLGGDTDTRAAIAGAIAGSHRGVEALPAPWLSKLHDRSRIEQLADGLHELARQRAEV